MGEFIYFECHNSDAVNLFHKLARKKGCDYPSYTLEKGTYVPHGPHYGIDVEKNTLYFNGVTKSGGGGVVSEEMWLKRFELPYRKLSFEGMIKWLVPPQKKELPKSWCVFVSDKVIQERIFHLCLAVGYKLGASKIWNERYKGLEVNDCGYVNFVETSPDKKLTVEEVLTLLVA